MQFQARFVSDQPKGFFRQLSLDLGVHGFSWFG
jgi:hypothetical protein